VAHPGPGTTDGRSFAFPPSDPGLADFALVESYLSTAAKCGISKLEALRDLFNGRAWLPPGLEPAG
jgi:hypothetical protein